MTLSKMSLFKISSLIIILVMTISGIVNPNVSSKYASIITNSLRYTVEWFTKPSDVSAKLTGALKVIEPNFSGTAN